LRSLITAAWLILLAFILVPPAVDYTTGVSYNRTGIIMELEAESDEIHIIGEEHQGNKMLMAFDTGNDYGVAVFSCVKEHYRYEEGLMSNNKDYIDVNLDVGWDIYQYRVSDSGIELMRIRENEGIWKTYADVACMLAAATLALCIFRGLRKRSKRKEKKRRRRKDKE
jgi:hypothetical protein